MKLFDHLKTFDERAEEYFNNLALPLADPKGLAITSYVIGCMDQKRIEELTYIKNQYIYFTNGPEKNLSKMEVFDFLLQVFNEFADYIKNNNYRFVDGSGWENDSDIEVYITTDDLVRKFLDFKQIYNGKTDN